MCKALGDVKQIHLTIYIRYYARYSLNFVERMNIKVFEGWIEFG